MFATVPTSQNMLGRAVDWVSKINAESLKYWDGLWDPALAGGNYAICQKYTNDTSYPIISLS